jgi:hypothetical protein
LSGAVTPAALGCSWREQRHRRGTIPASPRLRSELMNRVGRVAAHALRARRKPPQKGISRSTKTVDGRTSPGHDAENCDRLERGTL